MDPVRERLLASERTLESTLALAQSTEDVGKRVLGELERQRTQLEGATATLGDVEVTLDQSGSLLRGMQRRVQTHRWIVGAIVVVLLACVAVCSLE